MVQAHRKEKFTTELKARLHLLTGDVSRELGGLDRGPNPHELLEAALAACTSITVQMYADRKGWPLESADVEVKFLGDERKEVIVLERKLTLFGPLSSEQKTQLKLIAEKCPIHKVLTRGAKVETKFAEES